ncbi:hypothetical protein TMatcc_005417 [Talaromyces marneffei ATCC 18224]|uniref:Uncharacterized protein n=2 Tax=Talaromyces marneffei TaxID=37727 RepID=B6QAT7_TALMQ|nr:uncharacterized protein EYB26_006034 [Talaromyces marneffei]EEA26315.1 conserved hypothetical protein [Talaromyces marneffei ATCC 18224]KAE8555013.1 hypothetical protein EYB25_003560 [Talaromyces marneffei]QGA18350.1 hypothetical protein EYB26_006034 [Talaromyces marneffei]
MATTPTLQNASSKKRRFQSPITSYFTTSTTQENSDLSYQNYSAPTNTPTPTIPSNILSSLLGVGARVRKSVPEGYKTEQKKLTAYTIPVKTNSASRSTTTTTTVYSELQPFCGINKVGNFAVQTFPRPDEDYRSEEMMRVDELENVSMPSSSQESNASFSSANNKRTLEPDIEEDDEHDNGYIQGGIWQDTFPTISTYNTSSSNAMSRRTILSPRLGQHRRRIIAYNHTNSPKTHTEQENANPLATSVPYDGMDIDDFGEAEFLRRREEVDF